MILKEEQFCILCNDVFSPKDEETRAEFKIRLRESGWRWMYSQGVYTWTCAYCREQMQRYRTA
jgi:hypothetical protein